MTSRERFLAAAACQPLDRPPIWVMRQAGRYLPEYRELKAKSSFLEMVRTPELAAEVTLQPLRRFALDAAIIFSDILVIPEALGQGYKFRDAGGIEMDFRLEHKAQLDRLNPQGVADRLAYVGQALARVKTELKGQKALLGFGGSPWTLATYMLEGGSADEFQHSKAAFYSDRAFFNALMEKLTAALIEYFQMQIRAGADAIQIFDSWVGALSLADYHDYAFEASKRLVRNVQGLGVPVIYFGVETAGLLGAMAETGADVIGLDWRQPLDEGWHAVGHSRAVQGNLDPITLFAPHDVLEKRVHAILRSANGRPGHIFNLGHGIVPNTPVENVQAVVKMVREFRLKEANA